jgi:hypothetical protein
MQQACYHYIMFVEMATRLRILSMVFSTQKVQALPKQYVLVMGSITLSRTYFVAGISNFFSRSAAAREKVSIKIIPLLSTYSFLTLTHQLH